MSDYLDPNNEELLKDFYSEAEMQVEMLEQNILVLENDTANEDAIDEIFRAAHTLKGAAATVQMTELAEFTHIVEDVLDEIRSGKLSVDGDNIDLLLSSIDIIKEMLAQRSQGSVYNKDISGVKDSLKGLLAPSNKGKQGIETKVVTKSKAKPEQAPNSKQSGGSDLSEYELLELREATGEGEALYKVTVRFDEDNPMNTVGGIQVFASLKSLGTMLKTEPDFERLYEDVFYPSVTYYLASTANKAEISLKADISDVTIDSDIEDLLSSSDVVSKSSKDTETSSQPHNREQPEYSEPNKILKQNSTPASKESVLNSQIESTNDPMNNEVTDVTEQPEEPKKTTPASSSILRVESKRIDDLLNLVSETVINKATFNQVSNQFTDNMTQLQSTQSDYRQLIKDLFDSLPDYMERIEQGMSIKDVKRDILENYGNLLTMFDGIQTNFKGSIAKFRSTAQNLGRITSELQEGVMRIRMVPISQIFSRFPRLVRDLSKSLDKRIQLKIEGEDTELDKSVIEDLLDPLIHCVRNSLDHGIENPKDRKRSGKSEEGLLLLRASNEGNMILIEIYDDGRGIDIDMVKKRAIERDIIHPNKVLSDVEAYSLIFEPGFSTAKEVTNISGRGVGLDVVKKQIEKLNGSVAVSSNPGKGTRFTIKIPLTLAIIQGLLVRVGKEMYAIPITAVLDSHRIKPSDIKRIDNYEVFNVREDVVSLMRLNRIFNIPTDEKKEHYFVVIVGSGDKKMGLIVDSLIGEEDVVIKPLRDHYTNAPGIAGANITGDGTVSLIIDVSQLLELGQKQERDAREQRETTKR
jgi:two-component system chemotaxis sensor kinase CheA